MSRLDDAIRYETEHTALDFKRTQYVKAQHAALLKDVLSMVNAHDVPGDRFIVCGVDLKPDGSRTFVGVPRGEVVDAATYQQLVRENLEPDVHLEY